MNERVMALLRLALRNGMIGIPLAIIIILAMMILPMPPLLLDITFTFNIALSLIVIMSSIYINRPLEFAAFPTILLIATLLRLALNIASTRVVLLEGHTGTDAAGNVIESFGEFVIGGDYTVGIVIFAILVIINFVVVTKGAGRISEVSARFTLDAMPGKQMAIDADLNAGVIDQAEAKKRRAEVVAEADFYGSMDGASKFVRGDAVAGILILFINIIGGLIIGVAQHDMSFADAGHNYTLLTIGDGLVAQIPSLLLSTAAAIMVTRVSSEQNMGEQISKQMFGNPRSLAVTAAIIGGLGLIPGMPNVVFIGLGSLCGYAAYQIYNRKRIAEATPSAAIEKAPIAPSPSEIKDLSWDDVRTIDTVGLEVGYRLIPLVDSKQDGNLMARIKGVRKKLTQELGFLIPAVHIRDNLELSPTSYRITLLGVTVGEADIYPDRELAISAGQAIGQLQGIVTKDPAFGMDAVWIDASMRERAEGMGYTVVDPSTVIATHLNQILKKHAHELLGREEVQRLLDRVAADSPKLIDGLVPETLTLGALQKLLRNLLAEGVPIKDMRTIIETLTTEAVPRQDSDSLTEVVRASLGRLIVQNINGLDDNMAVAILDHNLERLLQEAMAEGAGMSLEPGLAERMHNSLTNAGYQMQAKGKEPILLVAPKLRAALSRFINHTLPEMHVLSFNEVPSNKKINIVASIGTAA
ncbi:MAG: flagellar biosynthesis protein FlhA [Gammaproteobacteria bacterium]|nr:flagellar biosynthesis protein FlhA [Gammaproteobacteria bacterium]